jgi:hypothetical protein
MQNKTGVDAIPTSLDQGIKLRCDFNFDQSCIVLPTFLFSHRQITIFYCIETRPHKVGATLTGDEC